MLDMLSESFHDCNSHDDEKVTDDELVPFVNQNIPEQRYLKKRQRLQAFKNAKQREAYYKEFKEEVEQNILTDLRAELDAQSLARSNNIAGENSDENSQSSLRLKSVFGHLQGGRSGNTKIRERFFSNGESDLESLYLSANNDLFRSFVRKSYKIKTSDDGGITNHEESATDNDSDIRSFLAGLGSSQKGQHILLARMKSLQIQL